MKRSLVLILLFVIALPAQAFAASMSAADVDQIYFEDYKSQVAAIKKELTKVKITNTNLCPDVATLTQVVKSSSTKYSTLVKNKASKQTLAGAKAQLNEFKKQLASAKKTCSLNIKEIKQGTNMQLKDIAKEKADIVKTIRDQYNGKGILTQAQFENRVKLSVSHINDQLDAILKSLAF
ncbi:hypothetical protein [Paenibacillus sp. FSL K6-2862]|uniref:hypothetical protein n=1 Tax=Paenibacillus sp. FSL K6-2862 TaxID=2921484 RepID=UPI0030FC1885